LLVDPESSPCGTGEPPVSCQIACQDRNAEEPIGTHAAKLNNASDSFSKSGGVVLIILIILILVFGFGGYRMGPGIGYYGGGGISLILLIILVLLLLRVI
jgi:hypothetical protein